MTKILNPVVFILAFVLSLALYWPAMHGTPIWDDLSYWFNDPVIRGNFSYCEIWLKFAWPLSVSLQKLTYSWWETNYFNYHLLSFILHFANSFLVYKLGRFFRLKYPIILFLLFLLHPAAVISTAWMIQLKTLLCMFFALASFLTYLKGNKDYRWMIFSWIMFLFSAASKSASLTLPLIYLVITLKNYPFKKTLWLIPFFAISLYGTMMVLKSDITIKGSEKASVITQTKVEELPATVTPEMTPELTPEPAQVEPVPQPEFTLPEIEAPKPEIEIPHTLEESKKTAIDFIGLNFGLISQTLHYYFWQTLMPTYNEPVKGNNYESAGIIEIVHILFLIILSILLWKDSAILYLAAAHFLLLPFIGIIPAPFMNVTWVSDQHLYLVLPPLLAFWLRLMDKIHWKYIVSVPSLLVLFFCYETSRATPIYKDQITFYEAALRYNPSNVPIAYNLAFSYLNRGHWQKAYGVASDMHFKSENDPLVKNNPYYHYIEALFNNLTKLLDKNAD